MQWRTTKQTDLLISPEVGHATERRGLLLMRAVWAKTHPHHKNSQPESLCLALKSQRLSPSLSRDSISNHSEINCCKWSNSCEASHGQVWEINTIMSQRANSLAARRGNAPCSPEYWLHSLLVKWVLQQKLWHTKCLRTRAQQDWSQDGRRRPIRFYSPWPVQLGQHSFRLPIGVKGQRQIHDTTHARSLKRLQLRGLANIRWIVQWKHALQEEMQSTASMLMPMATTRLTFAPCLEAWLCRSKDGLWPQP